MSTILGTIKESPGGDFGFFDPSTSEVLLGVLPDMPTNQFCDYATEALIKTLETTDARTAAQLGYAIGRLDAWLDKSMVPTSPMGRRNSPYTANPFNVQVEGKDTVIMFGDEKNGWYMVRPQEFMDFVVYIFRGGIMGWDLMPTRVERNVSLLREAIGLKHEI